MGRIPSEIAMNAYRQLVQAAQALEHAEIFEKVEPSSDEEILAFSPIASNLSGRCLYPWMKSPN